MCSLLREETLQWLRSLKIVTGSNRHNRLPVGFGKPIEQPVCSLPAMFVFAVEHKQFGSKDGSFPGQGKPLSGLQTQLLAEKRAGTS